MITREHTLTLLAAIILVAGLASLVWLALAWAARIAPRAAFTMAAANLSASLSLTLHALRGVAPDALTGWPADALAVASFALLGSAVTATISRQNSLKPALAVIAITTALLAACTLGGVSGWNSRIVNSVGSALTLAAGVTGWRQLAAQAGSQARNTLVMLPLFLLSLTMLSRLVGDFLRPGITGDLRAPSAFNVACLWLGFVLSLAQNATLAFLVLLRLMRRIERLLQRDPLTDTLNRRAFDQALAQAHAWLKRGRGYALVMIDMDRFKQLNDSLGHAAGDAALRQLVEELRPCVREVDHFGRLGGEEFCVLLPDTGIAGAALVAERMRYLVEAAPLRWLEQDWPLSASFGIAEAEPGDPDGNAVLARADRALYRAKGQGRNVVQE